MTNPTSDKKSFLKSISEKPYSSGSVKRTRNSSKKAIRSFILQMESLEERVVLDVSATVSGGELFISASNPLDLFKYDVYLRSSVNQNVSSLEWSKDGTNFVETGLILSDQDRRVAIKFNGTVHLQQIETLGKGLTIDARRSDTFGTSWHVGQLPDIKIENTINTDGGNFEVQGCSLIDVGANVTISTRNVPVAADPLTADSEGASGNISLRTYNPDPFNCFFSTNINPPKVVVNPGANLLADVSAKQIGNFGGGSIIVSAYNFNYCWFTTYSELFGYVKRDAEVIIVNSSNINPTVIRGASVDISTRAGEYRTDLLALQQFGSAYAEENGASLDDSWTNKVPILSDTVLASIGGNVLVGFISGLMKSILSSPISLGWRDATAVTNVGQNVQITAQNDISIHSQSEGSATNESVYTDSGAFGDKLVEKPFGVALGLSYGASNATTLLQSGSVISSTHGSVNISSNSTATSDSRSRVSQNVGYPSNITLNNITTSANSTVQNRFQLAVAVGVTKNNSNTTLEQGASIHASQQVLIDSEGRGYGRSFSSTDSFYDGLFGGSITVNINRSDVTTNVNGSITSGYTGSNAESLGFNPYTDVDYKSGQIRFNQKHGYTVGQRVYFNPDELNAIPGLSGGLDYFAIPVNDQTIRLSATYEDAINGKSISFGEMPTLTKLNISSYVGNVPVFQPGSAIVVDSVENTVEDNSSGAPKTVGGAISYAFDAGFSTGDLVEFTPAKGKSVGGLGDGVNSSVYRILKAPDSGNNGTYRYYLIPVSKPTSTADDTKQKSDASSLEQSVASAYDISYQQTYDQVLSSNQNVSDAQSAAQEAAQVAANDVANKSGKIVQIDVSPYFEVKSGASAGQRVYVGRADSSINTFTLMPSLAVQGLSAGDSLEYHGALGIQYDGLKEAGVYYAIPGTSGVAIGDIPAPDYPNTILLSVSLDGAKSAYEAQTKVYQQTQTLKSDPVPSLIGQNNQASNFQKVVGNLNAIQFSRTAPFSTGDLVTYKAVANYVIKGLVDQSNYRVVRNPNNDALIYLLPASSSLAEAKAIETKLDEVYRKTLAFISDQFIAENQTRTADNQIDLTTINLNAMAAANDAVSACVTSNDRSTTGLIYVAVFNTVKTQWLEQGMDDATATVRANLAAQSSVNAIPVENTLAAISVSSESASPFVIPGNLGESLSNKAALQTRSAKGQILQTYNDSDDTTGFTSKSLTIESISQPEISDHGLGGSKITLNAAHGLKDGDSVIYIKPESGARIAGLISGKPYFVISDPVDPKSFWLTERQNWAVARDPKKVAIFSEPSVIQNWEAVAVIPLGTSQTLASYGGISILATNQLADGTTAATGIGKYPTFEKLALLNTESAGLDQLKNGLKGIFTKGLNPIQTEIAGRVNSTQSAPTIGLAGVVGVTISSGDTTINIGSSAVLSSDRNIRIQANTTDMTRTTVESTISVSDSKDKQQKFAASLAVNIGMFTHNAIVNIADHATIDAGGVLSVDAKLTYPSGLDNPLAFSAPPEKPGMRYYNAILAKQLQYFVANNWTRTAVTSGLSKTKDDILNQDVLKTNESAYTIAGSVAYLTYAGGATVNIGSARINQNIKSKDNNKTANVRLNAKTDASLIDVVGNFEINISPSFIRDAFRRGLKNQQVFQPLGAQADSGGLGAAFEYKTQTFMTRVEVGSGALIWTAKEADGVVAKAETNALTITVGGSGTSVGAGVGGIAASILLNHNDFETLAQVHSGVTIEGGPLSILANDDSKAITVAGALSKSSGSSGIGFSLMIQATRRITQAILGETRETTPDKVGSSTIDVNGKIHINAENTGYFIQICVGGAFNGSKPTDSNPRNSVASAFNVNQDMGKFGIGVSGQVSLYQQKGSGSGRTGEVSEALINSKGSVKSTDMLSVQALNSTTVINLSGAISLNLNSESKVNVGFAGAASVIEADGYATLAMIQAATIVAGALDLGAKFRGKNIAIAAGLAAAANAETAAVGVTGSVGVLNIRAVTEAYVNHANVSISNDSTIKATDTGYHLNVAGAFGYGSNVGAGAAVAINTIDTIVNANVSGSTISQTNGNLGIAASTSEVGSVREVWSVAGAGAASFGDGTGVGASGMVTVNSLSEKIVSGLFNSNYTASTNSNLAISADDSTAIYQYGGAVGIAKNVGFGFAYAWNRLDQSVSATANGTIHTLGRVELTAESNIKNNVIVAGVAATFNSNDRFGVALSGSAIVSNITSAIKSGTTPVSGNSTSSVTAQNVLMKSEDNSGIVLGAGSLSLAIPNGSGFKAAVGASVIKFDNNSTVLTEIDKTNITTPGFGVWVRMDATNHQNVTYGAAGGAISGDISIGGSLVLNNIVHQTKVGIINNSSVNAPLRSIAVDRSKLKGGAGTASIATGAIAAGFAVVINTIQADVLNLVDRSNVIEGSAADLKSTTEMDVQAIALGLAVTAGFGDRIGAGIGAIGSAAINKIHGSTIVSIQNKSQFIDHTNQNSTTLDAKNTSQVQAIAGVLSLQTTVKNNDKAVTTAIGASVARNLVGTDTSNPFIVKTEVLDSSMNTTGGLRLSSLTNMNLTSGAGAGAGKGSLGGNSAVGFAGAGSFSDNETAVDTLALLGLGASVSCSNTSGAVESNASDTSTLLAVSGGVAFTGEIGGGSKVGVEVGAAIGYNISNNHVRANLEGAQILQSESLALNAISKMDFKTYAIGVAGSISGGGGSSIVSLQGAGSAARNIISNTVEASIKSSAGTNPSQIHQTGRISQAALDQTTSYAMAGGFAFGLQILSGDRVSAAVGVSIALNEVTDQVSAKIEGSTVTAAGAITQQATGNLSLSTLSIAGTLGVSVSKDPTVGVTGAGADARNIVKNTIESGLANTTSTLKAAGFTSNATEQSILSSNGGGVGVQIVVGSQGLTAAVGVGIARNEIADVIRSTIENAGVETSGDLSLNAESRINAKSLGFGVAVSVAVGSKAIALGGSGADSRNISSSSVIALIGKNSRLTATGNAAIAIHAKDNPTLEANAGAGSLSISGGALGGALAVGAVIAKNISTDQVLAMVGQADSPDNSTVNSSGNLSVKATSALVMKSTAVAVAAAASFSPKGIALSGSGADALNQSNQNLTASIEKGTIDVGSISISAISEPNITTLVGTGAFSGGLLGASVGISLGNSEINDRISAYINSATVNAKSGDISVDTLSIPTISTHVYATSASISIGIAGTGGNASATDNSVVKSYIGSNSKISATGGLFIRSVGTATDSTLDQTPNIKARSDGGNIGVGSVGVSWATVTSNPTINAFTGDGLDLSKVGSLTIQASSRANLQAESFAISVGGIAVTVNQAVAVNSGDVEAYTGKSVTLPSVVRIDGSGGAKMRATQMGVNAGMIGGGATLSSIDTSMKVLAKVGLDSKMNAPDGSLSISASGNDDTLASATSGTGGLASGFGTKSTIKDISQTTASIDGGNITTGSLNISSMHGHTYGLKVDSTNIGVVIGVGVSMADFNCNSNVTTRIGQGTIVTASDQVNVTANNRLQNNSDGVDVNGGGGSLFNGVASLSRSDVNANSIIEIGDNARIYSGIDFFTRNGGIDIAPSISFISNDTAYVKNIGILASGSGIRSEVQANLTNRVQIGQNVVMDTEGNLNIGSAAHINSSTSTDCYGWGTLASGIDSKSYNNIKLNQDVTAGRNLVIWAAKAVNLTPGNDPISGIQSSFSINSSATGKVDGFVAVPVTYAESRFWNHSSLTVGANAKVESGQNLNLGAYYTPYTPEAYSRGEGRTLGFWKSVSDDKKNEAYNSSVVSLQGTYTAGRYNRADISVSRNGNQFSNAVTISPSQTFDRPLMAVATSNFNPLDYVDKTFTGATAAVLKRGVSSSPVTVVDLSPIFVSGGSINIKADTINDGHATLTANVAQVNILNDSTNYLMVEDVQVADVKGGDVNFLGKADGSSVLGKWDIKNLDRGKDPKITIKNSYDQNLPNSDFGPAIFIVGQISNNSGAVDIENKTGSFGVKDTISGGQINLNIPNGVVVIDTPNDPYSVVTNQRINDVITWPGGKDFTSPQVAIMYAINALYPNSGDSNTSLNSAVYGQYTDVNSISRVFFGGSFPYHKVANGNGNDSKAENIRLSSNAWPGNAVAYKFANGDKSLGWLPSLVRTSTTFTSSDYSNLNTSASDGSAIFGDVVVINAKIVNINAPIIAGRDRKVNHWSLVLDAAAQTKLDDYKKQYDSGAVSSATYRIESQYSSLANTTDNRIGATFDASTGQIILDSISSSRGQSISISGQIVNTNPGGGVESMVRVTGGSGNITITNNTHYSLVTENIETGSSTKTLVGITDTLIPDISNQQKLYVYDGQNITYYSGPAGVDLSVTTTPSALYENSSTASYQPVSGSRWQWQLQATLTRRAEPRWINGTWDGFYYDDWKFSIPNGPGTSPWTNTGGKPSSASVVNDIDLPEFQETLSASIIQQSVLQSASPGVAGIPSGRKTYYPSEIRLTMTNSLKADWPINVSFEGIGYGKVQVQSRGDLIVKGMISSPNVQLVSQDAHIIQLSPDTRIESGMVSLDAQQGIGSQFAPIVVITDKLSATSTIGDIYIQANEDQKTRDLLITRIATTRDGDISLVADGNIKVDPTVNTPVLQGDRISLVSGYGSIGSSLKPVTIEPAITTNSYAQTRIKLDAREDVFAVGTRGDILVEQINSSENAIAYLKSQGSIYNAYSWNVDSVAVENRSSAFQRLGAFDLNAWKADLDAYKNSVNSTYQNYWFLMQNGEAVTTRTDVTPPNWFGLPIYEDVTVFTLKSNFDLIRDMIRTDSNPNPTDAQVQDKANQLYHEYTNDITKAFGYSWSSRPEFKSYQENYSYSPSAEVENRFKSRMVLTEANILASFQTRALDQANGTVIPQQVNIKAGNIRLVSDSGSIGKIDTPSKITVAQLQSGNMTESQKVQMYLADSPGDVKVIKDSSNMTTALELNVRRQLVIQTPVTGRFDAEAPGGIIVTQPSGNLMIGQTRSTAGLIDITASGSLLSASEPVTMRDNSILMNDKNQWAFNGTSQFYYKNAEIQDTSQQLNMTNTRDCVNSTWYRTPVPTSSFQVSFIYQADSGNTADGLAFVLQNGDKPLEMIGDKGGSLGYYGMGTEKKVGFLINIYQNAGTGFDITGKKGAYKSTAFSLKGQPIYVTLTYDATAQTFTSRLSLKSDGSNASVNVYRNINLENRLGGKTATMGFTSASGNSFGNQYVRGFRFDSSVANKLKDEKSVVFDPTTNQTQWKMNSGTGTKPFTWVNNTLQFPNQKSGLASAWFGTPVNLNGNFEVSFNYLAEGTSPADGLSFVLQNSPDGTNALGAGGANLGYGGILGKKVGYQINLYGTQGTRFNSSNNQGGVQPATGVSIAGKLVYVNLLYNATDKTLTEILSNDPLKETYKRVYTNVDLKRELGADTAIIGFTASSGFNSATQTVSNFKFYSPSVYENLNALQSESNWHLIGGVQTIANDQLAIPNLTNQSTATWFTTPVSTASFKVEFDYFADATAEPGDGLAFVLQNTPAGMNAIGNAGGDLGYKGIQGDQKVAYLINVYKSGTGTRFDTTGSTGSYNPVSFKLIGRTIHVELRYDQDKKQLIETLTTDVKGELYTKTYNNVDIAALLNRGNADASQKSSPFAYIGFTSGTGLASTKQTIKNFKFESGSQIRSNSTVSLTSWSGDIGQVDRKLQVWGNSEPRVQPGSSTFIQNIKDGDLVLKNIRINSQQGSSVNLAFPANPLGEPKNIRVSLQLSITSGSLIFKSSSGVNITRNGTVWTLSGIQSVLNKYLTTRGNTVYQPGSDASGVMYITGRLSDGNSVKYGQIEVDLLQPTSPVRVQPVLEGITVEKGVRTDLKFLSIPIKVDSSVNKATTQAEILVGVSGGTVSATRIRGIRVRNGSKYVVLSGTIEKLTAYLLSSGKLYYNSPRNFDGNEILNFSIRYRGQRSSFSMPILVNAVKVKPASAGISAISGQNMEVGKPANDVQSAARPGILNRLMQSNSRLRAMQQMHAKPTSNQGKS